MNASMGWSDKPLKGIDGGGPEAVWPEKTEGGGEGVPSEFGSPSMSVGGRRS